MSACYPNRVKCTGCGLTFGYLGHPIMSTIDTRRAGPGELTVFCIGPSSDWPALSELKDKDEDSDGCGVFTLIVRAQTHGLHHLYIRYNNRDVKGSPFLLRVSSASLLTFTGSGLHGGILGYFEPRFIINTEKAGRGDIKVKIGGPRGAFNMTTRAFGKSVYCSYNVMEPGEYIIHVLWCGDPVPDSPFRVHIWKTAGEEIMYQQRSLFQQVTKTVENDDYYYKPSR